jgi:putative DNA primase/helicase
MDTHTASLPQPDDDRAPTPSPTHSPTVSTAVPRSPLRADGPNADPETTAWWDEFDRMMANPAARAMYVAGPPGTPSSPPARSPEQILVDKFFKEHPLTALVDGRLRRCHAGVWQPLDPLALRAEIIAFVDAAYVRGEYPRTLVPRMVRLFSDRIRAHLAANVPFPAPTPEQARAIQPQASSLQLPASNGFLDTATGQLRSFVPADGVTATLPYAFDPGAVCPVWQAYLASTLPDCADFLQEFAGLCLTTVTAFEVALWLHGPPGAGKSTFIHGLQVMLGPFAGTLDPARLAAGRFTADDITGKTLLVCTEPLDGHLPSTARFNAFVSGEPLTIEPKYRAAQTVQPRAKLLWAYTTLPRVPNAESPLLRRVRIVPFLSRPETQQDPSLKDRLRVEGPGLLNWALAGLARLTARGRFAPPPAIEAATAAYRLDNDIPAQFIADRYERHPEGRMAANRLYTVYKEWCLDNRHVPVAQNVIARDWQRLGLERRLSDNRHFWYGLRPRSNPAAEIKQLVSEITKR